jgi:hypothetical protein
MVKQHPSPFSYKDAKPRGQIRVSDRASLGERPLQYQEDESSHDIQSI